MYVLLDENNYIKATSTCKLVGSFMFEFPINFDFEKQGCYQIVNKELILDEEKVVDIDKNELREKREFILAAFDIYKSNVNYGIEQEENKEDIINWYQNLLDLNEMAFNTIPIKIKKYMKGGTT